MRAGGGPGRISSWPQRLRLRLLLFAFGDFAFNLYWQSVTLFLLFYYTDAVGLPITVAATIFLVASIWDGIANFIAGIIVDRRHATVGRRGYAGVLTLGSIPLGLSFVLTYIPPLAAGYWGVAGVFTHDVAETKVRTTKNLAEQHEFPLLVTMEPESSSQ